MRIREDALNGPIDKQESINLDGGGGAIVVALITMARLKIESLPSGKIMRQVELKVRDSSYFTRRSWEMTELRKTLARRR